MQEMLRSGGVRPRSVVAGLVPAEEGTRCSYVVGGFSLVQEMPRSGGACPRLEGDTI